MPRNSWLRKITDVFNLTSATGRKPTRPKLAVEALESRALLAVFTVTSTADTMDASDGVLTLREAIVAANTHSNVGGPDQIHFNIPTTDPGYNPATGAFTIRPTSSPPVLGDPVILDGWTQPGWSGTPLIELDGSQAGTFAGASGLQIRTQHSTVRGLVINRFVEQGIVVAGGFFGPLDGWNKIQGCYIGTDVTGTQALGNGTQGIWIVDLADHHLVGTDGDGVNDAWERNVISGNGGEGIWIHSGVEHVIAGNFIGTDATGTVALGNQRGVVLTSGHVTSRNLIGTNADGVADDAERNIISGNHLAEVWLGFGHDNAGNNVVAGNYIGTDVTGTVALGAAEAGVVALGRDNRIGTNGDGINDVAERNVVSGNYSDGAVFLALSGNVVAGNYIGTDASGTIALGSPSGRGFYVTGTNHRIGTNGDGLSDEAERNIISGNGTGLVIFESHNQVTGNFIGLDASGNPLGNSGNGVELVSLSHHSQIGGEGSLANTIAHNGGSGITVQGGDAVGNSIRRNSIHSNGGLGIDLTNQSGETGVTSNDPGDADEGANRFQNFPVLDSVQGGATTRVTGTLNSTASTTFTLDFYANTDLDPSGYGEGERWLGSATVTTDAAGNASFDVALAAATASGEHITSTATDPDGNTSEFSAGPVVTNLPPTAHAGGPYEVPEGDSIHLDGSGSSDPDQASSTLTYTWDLDGDNNFGETGPSAERGDETGMTPTFSAAGLDGPSSVTVMLRVTDNASLSNTDSATITINNADPTIHTVANDGPVDEGSSVTVMVSADDPAGASDPLNYEFDFDDDGIYEIGPQLGNSASHTFGDNGSYRVNVRVTDGDGGEEISSTDVIVNNVAPTATDNAYVTFQATGISGNVISDDTGSGADSDPAGINDPLTVSGYTNPAHGALVLNSDGSFIYTPESTFSGTDTFTYMIRDGDGGADTATVTITVAASAPGSVTTVPDQCLGGTALLVMGTLADDQIHVSPGPGATLNVTINNVSSNVPKPSGRIIVLAGSGDDNVQIAGSISNMVWLYGDAGNDRLNAGNGGSMLFGGDGDDDLHGGNGRDVMIGGDGADKLVANSGDDILVAGFTLKDERSAAGHEEFWCDVLEEWNSDNSFDARVENLRNGTGGNAHNNGSYLWPNVVDDVFEDQLNGAAGDDWLLFSSQDKESGKAEASN